MKQNEIKCVERPPPPLWPHSNGRLSTLFEVMIPPTYGPMPMAKTQVPDHDRRAHPRHLVKYQGGILALG